MPKHVGSPHNSVRVGVMLYQDDLVSLTELKKLVGTHSRSAVIRLALRVLKQQLEMGKLVYHDT